MSRTTLPLTALRAFEAAARHLSFTRAAEELHVTQAAVSHQVKALEDLIGVELFRRQPRSLILTTEGQALLPDLRDAFDRMAQAIDRIGRQAGSRTLIVSLLTTFALTWLVPRLHRFQALHPDIDVRMTASQKVIDFEREDVDVAIRYAADPDVRLFSLRLFGDCLTPLCGRKLRDRLRSPDDLRKVPLIESGHEPEWPVWLKAVGLGDLKPRRSLTFDSTKIAVEAAIAGAGVAIGPPNLFHEDLAEGRLFQPFPQEVESGKAWWLVCPREVVGRPKIRAFVQWIEQEIASETRAGEKAPRPGLRKPPLAAA
jgi:LysR family glycine cleavage system transcriptional activator